MAKQKNQPTMIVEELESGRVRLTASEGGTLRHKATGRVHSEAVVRPEHIRLFEVV